MFLFVFYLKVWLNSTYQRIESCCVGGTFSEVTIAAVVSDPITHLKTPLIDPKLVPKMAALDANLLISLPAKVTADTGIDALTHALEAYISRNATQETQAYSIAAIKLIFKYLPLAVVSSSWY
ncbi:hypothetical protein AK966_17940 [Vibrio sp. PID23_8]|nr:hypothetical protein AK966_17940 [Vibrio sp. PID23_8]